MHYLQKTHHNILISIQRYLLLILSVFIFAFSGFNTPLWGFEGEDLYRREAVRLSMLAVSNQFSNLEARFEKSVRPAYSAQSLKAGWNNAVSRSGDFRRVHNSRAYQANGLILVTVTLVMDKEAVDVQFSMNERMELTGCFFQPAWQEPYYVRKGSYTEVDVKAGIAPFEIECRLTIPLGMAPYPAVILVHGFGQLDMDSTVYGTRIFRDLAHGLAVRGIAVVRFHKRGWASPQFLTTNNSYTVKDEAFNDIASVIFMVLGRKDIDPARIYLAGHGLGGWMAPLLARDNPGIAGVVMLAPPARTYTEIIYDRAQSILKMDGSLSHSDINELTNIRRRADIINRSTESESDAGTNRFFGHPVSYWISMNRLDAVSAARAYRGRVLVMYGKRDFETPAKDYAVWTNALKNRQNTVFNIYDNLDHLFIRGYQKSSPEQYKYPGHFDGEALQDIALWIREE